MVFLLMGDEHYAHTLYESIMRINNIYSDSKIILYDWGLSKSTIDRFNNFNNIRIINWQDNISKSIKNKKITRHDINIYLYFDRIKSKYIKFIFRILLKIHNFKFIYNHILNLANNFERMVHEKIACTQDCSNIVGDEPIIFLDADAILISNVDEVIKQDIDVAVTLRRQKEIDFGVPCQVLNSGVLFFGKNKFKRNIFIKAWQDEAYLIDEPYIDQTSLTRLIEKLNPKLYDNYNYKDIVKIDNEELNILMLSCDKYNYNWIEEVIKDKEKIKDIKILHFKGSRHTKDTFKNLLSKLNI